MSQYQEYTLKNEAVFVGLEDSKRSWKVCVRSNGKILTETSMPAVYKTLHAFFINKFPECKIKVIYEAGFGGFWLHDLLVGDGIECIVTPPNKVTESISSNFRGHGASSSRINANTSMAAFFAASYSSCVMLFVSPLGT
jgi:transposase